MERAVGLESTVFQSPAWKAGAIAAMRCSLILTALHLSIRKCRQWENDFQVQPLLYLAAELLVEDP